MWYKYNSLSVDVQIENKNHNFNLSDDVAVIQWIASCHKNRMTTFNNTLARRRNVIHNVPVNNAFSS